MKTDELRALLGPAAVVSESEAARRLPFRDSDARAWLRERALVREVRGLGECVCWGDVLDAIRLGDGPTPETAPRAKLARAGLQPRRRTTP